jgi:hypothetical protein
METTATIKASLNTTRISSPDRLVVNNSDELLVDDFDVEVVPFKVPLCKLAVVAVDQDAIVDFELDPSGCTKLFIFPDINSVSKGFQKLFAAGNSASLRLSICIS